MAELCIYHSQVFYEHRPRFYHPENPSRLERLVEGLRSSGLWDRARVLEPPGERARRELALRIHSAEYVELVERMARAGGGMLDADTYVSPETPRAAMAVLAAVEDAVERLLSGECRVAFVAGRPPGHHAGRNGAAMGAPTLGFCIFNASALASKLLADRLGSVVHIDFDLHHGNGTQDIHYTDPRIVHIDLHQDPSTIYPGTGWPWEKGGGEARGTKANIVLPPGSGDDVYEEALGLIEELAAKKGWRSSVLVFSAGFDAYQGDGLGALSATTNTFYALGEKLPRLLGADKTLVVWEGGYGAGLVRGAPAFLAGLLGLENPYPEEPTRSTSWALEGFREWAERLRRELGTP